MTKLSTITTFNRKGYYEYGKNMLNSFIKYWPKEVTLYVFYEDEKPTETANNIIYLDLNKHSPSLLQFKERHKNNSLAKGQKLIKIDKKGKKIGLGFKWDAIRFSHKVYAIMAANELCNSDLLFWVDGDTKTFDHIPLEFLKGLLPKDKLTCYLGRKGKYSECGFVGYNLQHEHGKSFLARFKQMYDTDEIFNLSEWHDSFVYDVVRQEFETKFNISNVNLSANMDIKEGHPFINSCLGKYLDHLKGERKTSGKSLKKDLIIGRSEKYWQDLK